MERAATFRQKTVLRRLGELLKRHGLATSATPASCSGGVSSKYIKLQIDPIATVNSIGQSIRSSTLRRNDGSDMIPIDYESANEIRFRQYVARRQRVSLDEVDLDQYFREQRQIQAELDAKLEAERAEKNRELARAVAEKQRAEAAHREILQLRWRTRNIVPADPPNIKNLDDLEAISSAGQGFCEGTVIEGDDKAKTRIDINLELCNLRNSAFRNVIFGPNADLGGANFANSKFESVVFEGETNIKDVNFDEVEFIDVVFSRSCRIQGGSFQFAKVLKGVTIDFDRNYIAGATFSNKRSDTWFQLSNAYAGLFQYVNLTLSGIYFGFLLLKLYLFKVLSLTQAAALAGMNITNMQTGGMAVSVFDFVFGAKISSVATAMVILVYQAMRVFITMRIGPLIEDERRTGCTPPREDFESYRRPHNVVRLLGFAALLLFGYELWGLLTQKPLFIPFPSSAAST